MTTKNKTKTANKATKKPRKPARPREAPVKAYHLISEDCRLKYGDGRVVKVGDVIEVTVKPRLCKAGLHASRRPLDTLQYAPSASPRLCRVEVSGDVVEGDDKLCGRRRVVTAWLTSDETARLCQEFALKAADMALDEAAKKPGGGAVAKAAIQKGRAAVEAARRYLAGLCPEAELLAAGYAAWAARDAAWAAGDTAWAAWYGAGAAGNAAGAAGNAAGAAGRAAGAAGDAAGAAGRAAGAGVPRSRLDGVMEGLVREAFDKKAIRQRGKG